MLGARCIIRFRDKNNVITGYRLQDKCGNIKDVNSNALKKAIESEKIQVSNLILTSDNRIVQSESTEGKVDKPLDFSAPKYGALKAYEAKEKLLGIKLFEFRIDNYTGSIIMSKYYGSKDTQECIIPTFVDEIANYKYITATPITFGAFSSSKPFNKVIMQSNVKGILENTFYGFDGDSLDLSDFDTSNITGMPNMIVACNLEYAKLDNKFDTSKVTDTGGMFWKSKIKHLYLGDKFDTSRVKSMYSMFCDFHTEKLELGNKFNTSNITSMEHMFQNCHTKYIDLGDGFCLHKNTRTDYMFNGCNAERLIIGQHVTQETRQILKSITTIPIVIKA